MEGWSSLEPYRVGIQRGIRALEKGRYRLEVILVNSTASLFKLLVAGRVDVIVVPSLSGVEVFKDYEFKGVRQLEPPLFSQGLYLYLHRKNRDLVPAITEVLRRMRVEGRIRQIRSDYLKEISSP